MSSQLNFNLTLDITDLSVSRKAIVALGKALSSIGEYFDPDKEVGQSSMCAVDACRNCASTDSSTGSATLSVVKTDEPCMAPSTVPVLEPQCDPTTLKNYDGGNDNDEKPEKKSARRSRKEPPAVETTEQKTEDPDDVPEERKETPAEARARHIEAIREAKRRVDEAKYPKKAMGQQPMETWLASYIGGNRGIRYVKELDGCVKGRDYELDGRLVTLVYLLSDGTAVVNSRGTRYFRCVEASSLGHLFPRPVAPKHRIDPVVGTRLLAGFGREADKEATSYRRVRLDSITKNGVCNIVFEDNGNSFSCAKDCLAEGE